MKSEIIRSSKPIKPTFSVGEVVEGSSGRIVLVTGPGHVPGSFAGVVLHECTDNVYNVGHYQEEWAKDFFILFDGELKVSNL